MFLGDDTYGYGITITAYKASWSAKVFFLTMTAGDSFRRKRRNEILPTTRGEADAGNAGVVTGVEGGTPFA
jgi:hypothetical protein